MMLADSGATESAGSALASAVLSVAPERFCIWLSGELGAGKTTFSRGFLRGLGHTGRVPSPTYTLVEPYHAAGYSIFHLDLYRLADPLELDFLGVDEWSEAGAILLVEWPERGGNLLPPADLEIALALAGHGRTLVATARSAAAESVVAGWENP
jgi:tRNA threonylcarbamoyladenosine biosynthesis protein TsaE